MQNNYLDIRQIAQYLNLSTSFIYKEVSKNKIPYFRDGKALRFDTEAINNWMNENLVPVRNNNYPELPKL